MREKIAEEYPPQWVNVQQNISPRNRQGCLHENLLKRLGMIQCVFREDFLFLSVSVAAV